MKLELHVATADEKLTEHAVVFLEGLFEEKPVKSSSPTDSADRRAIDPVAVAALVLSIPGTALALTQLVDRLKKSSQRREIKTTIIPLLESVRGRRQQTQLLLGDKVIDLTRASADDVLDALEAAAINIKDTE